MRIRRSRSITAATAEQLLSGSGPLPGGDGDDDRLQRLAAVLDAAAGPADRAELAGRDEALAGFLANHLHPTRPPRRQSMLKTTLLKILTVKAATIAAVTVGASGVALAASTGALPNPMSDRPTPASTAGRPHASMQPSAHRSGDGRGHDGDDPSMFGHCRAFTAGAGSEHGEALQSEGFEELITAAGGKDKVEAFCAGVLAGSPAASAHPSEGPDGDHRGGHPSEHPSEHAGGPSSEHPSGRSGR